MNSKKQIALVLGVVIAYVIFALSASAIRESREVKYQENLIRVLDKLILLNVTMANQMVRRTAISEDSLNKTLRELDLLQQEFKQLGPAPKELMTAANSLNESIGFYSQAYVYLADQNSSPIGFQADTHFLEIAMTAGEQAHLVTQLLYSLEQSGTCIGAQRLLPLCWIW